MNYNMENNKKIVIVGRWQWDIYEEGLSRGFETNGWSVLPFKFNEHLRTSFGTQIQVRIKNGPEVRRINNILYKIIIKEKPAAVFCHQADLILPSTLKRIKSIYPKCVLIYYNNDDIYTGLQNRIKWRHFLWSLQHVDLVFVYRPNNIVDAKRWGEEKVFLLLPYYLSYRHKPMRTKTRERKYDVIFIGHYEPDERGKVIEFLLHNGISVKIYGTNWEKGERKYSWIGKEEILPVRGDRYAVELASAKIALVFLSKKNRDVWTRRCFEIPACCTLMMAPRTCELQQLFKDGSEAVYYDSEEDLLKKIKYYLAHDYKRRQIARAGWQRCVSDNHSEIGRTRQIIESIEEIT